MDKQQALYDFWHKATGLEAYEENSIPDNAKLPYCTYQTIVSSLNDPVFPMGHIWDDGTSYEALDGYLKAFEEYVGLGITKPLDKGYMFICKGTPFAQRIKDDVGSKGYLINIQIEFLSN